jgi:hypothetical protein
MKAFATFALAMLSLGCGDAGTDGSGTSGDGGATSTSSDQSSSDGSMSNSASATSTSSSSGTGGMEPSYPSGPYGFGVGDTIANLALRGAANFEVDPAIADFALGEFFNPSGMGVFPSDSVFPEGTLKPRSLVVIATALWSSPDDQEFTNLIPTKYPTLRTEGVDLLALITDSNSINSAPTDPDITAFGNDHSPSYPIAREPLGMLVATLDAYPTHFLIDTRTMEIKEISAGVPLDDVLWNHAAMIANP